SEHPLRFSWSFWFMHRAPGQKIDDYEAAMIKIATFGTVEAFWAVYSHLQRPHQVQTITDYHMFRAGVRPVWEDPANMNGGKWMIRLKKGLASRLWERLAMAVVGDVFAVGDDVCGIVLSIRNSEDILSLWNKSALDAKTNIQIRDIMKQILGIPGDCVMEYKAHNDSLKDNSSFRNTDVYK
ncbi:eukaryotic translation initiation factor 4E, partial [Martensiomyces pterosporus]